LPLERMGPLLRMLRDIHALVANTNSKPVGREANK
jgi:hypothetical protein